MRTLNVFKLARNVDYSLKSSGGGGSGGGAEAGTSRRQSTKKSLQQRADAHSGYRSGTYTRVDPDLVMMASPVKEPNGTPGSASIVPVKKVGNLSGDAVDSNVSRDTESVSGESYAVDSSAASPMSVTDATFPAERGLCDGGTDQISKLAGHPVNGSVNGAKPPEPEPYKRLVNEAPFHTTAQEPPLDLDSTVDGSGSGGQVSRTASTKSKADSRVSVSTFKLELDWMDPRLIAEGRRFVRRNFLSLMFAHFVGLAFLLAVRPVAAILLRHGKFHRAPKRHHWHMYLLLLRRLKSWYERGDLADGEDEVTGEILQLRRSICSAGRNFRKFLPPPAEELELGADEAEFLAATKADLESGGLPEEGGLERKNLAKIFATVNPDVPWSQYDLAVTQFAFFGLPTLFPAQFGIHKEEGMAGFVHLWAVLGHLLGLEDRFNLCRPENFDEETNGRVLRDVFLFSFRIMDAGSFRMVGLMCDGCRYFTLFPTRLRVILLFMARVVVAGCEDPNRSSSSSGGIWGKLKWHERLSYNCHVIWTKWLSRIFVLRILANVVARVVLSVAYGVLRAQLSWRAWRLRKRKPADWVMYPNSVLHVDANKA